MKQKLPRYLTTEKSVGETPLVALERLREEYRIPSDVPLAYAGRLDPMASGKLLILVGDECKVQEKYHAFDKEYRVEVLLGASSDTGDILGIVSGSPQIIVSEADVQRVLTSPLGDITLPYPHFSSKTVHGKPLHVWTLEGRLDEIEIPKKTSRIYRFKDVSLRTVAESEIRTTIEQKIETIPEVTDPRKALGADFRRDAVRTSWGTFFENPNEVYQILSFSCTASSGTYMRSLASHIAEKLRTSGLAYSIHRTIIGTYMPLWGKSGFWTRRF